MDPDGDITDAFDDGELAKSIEAGQKGPWNDESAIFEDPKIETLNQAIKKAVTTPKHVDYKQRRLHELQQRGEKDESAANKKKAAARTPLADAAAAAPWGDATPVWNEHGTVVESQWTDRRSPANTPDPDGSASNVVQARRASDRVEPIEPQEREYAEERYPTRVAQSLVVSYVPSILAAILVFCAATVVHGLFVGWQIDLLLRAGAAMAITGILWCRFQAGRLRAMTIATITYGALFVPSDRLGDPENVFAVFLGLLIVVAGAGLIGVQRDEFGAERL